MTCNMVVAGFAVNLRSTSLLRLAYDILAQDHLMVYEKSLLRRVL